MWSHLQYDEIIKRNKISWECHLIDHVLHAKTELPALRRRWTLRRRRKRKKIICSKAKMYMQIYNNRKTSRVLLGPTLKNIQWELIFHKKQYVAFVFRELSEYMVEQFKQVVKHSWCPWVEIKIRRRPGLIRIPLRSILWALRQARPQHNIFYVHVFIPRAHGYRKLKKVARRKKGLQRLRARLNRYAC